jgi:Caspase domain
MGSARVFLVGVRSTTWDARLPDLPGVVADITALATLLRTRNFDVTVASGADLTIDGVSKGLLKLLDDSGEGDLGVMYLSGHGYRLADQDGDETDRWDEAFVCSDGPIRDDWFRLQLWPRMQPGSRIVAVIDACHSASALTMFQEPPAAPAPVPIVTWRPGPYRLVLSACKDEEVAFERPGGIGGVVTGQMLEVLANQPRLSYRDLWGEVAQVRRWYEGIGEPQIDYLAPDDKLLESPAFWPFIDSG